MTYFRFLSIFLVVPIALLAILITRKRRQGIQFPTSLREMPAWSALVVHIVLAVVYTTPWDNYLVATGVWWYEPSLVTGITLGWVPIEEYTFFVLQTLLTGMLLLWLGLRLRAVSWPPPPRPRLCMAAAGGLGLLWIGSVGALLSHWQPGTYLALELVWMLPPIMLQLAVGGDHLWHQRQLVAAALVLPILYLSAADAIAIGYGTWTIDPSQSTGIMLGGLLPLEELVFFTLTNVLIVFGMVLMMGSAVTLVRSVRGRFTHHPESEPQAT